MTKYYRHFKGNCYRILHRAFDCDTVEPLVVYQKLYGEGYDKTTHEGGSIWVRKEAEFFDNVTRDGKTFPRFKEISEEEAFAD